MHCGEHFFYQDFFAPDFVIVRHVRHRLLHFDSKIRLTFSTKIEAQCDQFEIIANMSGKHQLRGPGTLVSATAPALGFAALVVATLRRAEEVVNSVQERLGALLIGVFVFQLP